MLEADEVEVERIVARSGEGVAASGDRRDADAVTIGGAEPGRHRGAGPGVHVRGCARRALDHEGLVTGAVREGLQV